MDLQLSGRRALVTGGTRGIGRAIVEELVDEGVHVAFCARDAAEIAATERALAERGGPVTGSVVDVVDAPALVSWVTTAGDALGGIDIVVSNVSALAIPENEDSWRASFEVDLMGAVRMVGAAMPYLQASDAASIVAVSSVSGREIDFAAGPYATMKAALVHYVQGLAHQLAGQGLGPDAAGQPGAVRRRPRAEPDRPHGRSTGDGPGGGVPGQPGFQLHHRNELGRRRCPDPRRPALTPDPPLGWGSGVP